MNHSIFEKASSGRSGFKTKANAFRVSMKGEIEETFTNSEDCVKATAIDICEQYTFAPFMAVLSLCNVIESPIYLFTRLLSDKRLMSLFNNKIEPEETTGRPFYLFWMNLSSDNSRLNHFVPLLCEDLFTYQTTTRTNTKTETDVFDTATMSSIFTAIGNKRKETIFPEHPFMKCAKIINNVRGGGAGAGAAEHSAPPFLCN